MSMPPFYQRLSLRSQVPSASNRREVPRKLTAMLQPGPPESLESTGSRVSSFGCCRLASRFLPLAAVAATRVSTVFLHGSWRRALCRLCRPVSIDFELHNATPPTLNFKP